ncbi:MAG: oxidoreductase [Sphingobacteriales bacterium]|nr:MAG: oxidoreductase [Sphingobacteriales bacterium]
MAYPIKTALLAYGMSGRVFHAPFLSKSKNFDFFAVLERTKTEAQKDYPNMITYHSIEELLSDTNIELVIINTPNNTHYDFAIQALNAGKHILIEKPFAPTNAEAQHIFDLGASKNLKVMAYQNRRFDSDFLALKQVLETGKLGKITEAHFRFDRFRNTIGVKKFKEAAIAGSGIFYDLGAHLIDQAIALFGTPQSFTKTYGKFRQQTEVDDYAQAQLKYADGKNVFITTNMLVLKPQEAYTVYGTNGTFTKLRADEQENQLIAKIDIDDISYGKEKPGNDGYITYLNQNAEIIDEIIPAQAGNYMEVFNQVFLTIRENKPYFVKSDDILAQLEILQP